MRPIGINFAPPSPVWQRLALACAAGLVALSFAGLHAAWQIDASWQAMKDTNDALERRIDRARAAASVVDTHSDRPDPRRVLADKLATMSAYDAGDVLRMVDGVAMPGVRVVDIQVDAREGTARVRVDLPDISTASAYLQELDAGMPVPAWALESVRAQGGRFVAEFVHRRSAR